MPILIPYRTIRHFLGMYITKQAEQEIYLIAQESNDGCKCHYETYKANFIVELCATHSIMLFILD